jgi:hypothetical protein
MTKACTGHRPNHGIQYGSNICAPAHTRKEKQRTTSLVEFWDEFWLGRTTLLRIIGYIVIVIWAIAFPFTQN